MKKTEFMKELEEALAGEVSENVRQDSLRYYSQYIDSEMAKGKSEEQAIGLLGSGRIIAKTVIEARGGEYGDPKSSYEKMEKDSGPKKNQVPFKAKAKGIAIIVAVICILVFLIGLVIHVIWALLPVIIIGYLIYYLVKKI